MRKRPCCILAIGVLLIQLILVGGFQIARDLKPSYLEQNYEENEEAVIQGTIFSREKRDSYFIYRLKNIQVSNGHGWTNVRHEKLLINISNTEIIPIGNTVQASGKIKFFQENRNPGNFNQKFYYQKQQIHAQLWCDQVQINNPKTNHIVEILTEIREYEKEMLIHSLGKNAGNSMAAILLGNKKDLDQDVKQLYQKGGIGHILAISGLHMSFIGIGLYQLLRKIGCGFAVSGITGISLLLLYTIMIGAGVSSIRAVIMYIIRMGAEISGRDYDLLTSLSIAAIAIMLWQPLYIFDAGFLFSFGAIFAMIFINPLLEQTLRFPKLLCPGIAIQIMLLPITMYYYFEVPLWSVLTNLIVIPFMSILLGVGILGLILLCIWYTGGNLILQFCKIILWGYEKLCLFMINLPFGRIVTGKPAKWIVFLYYGLLLISYLIWKCWDIQAKKQKENCKNRKELLKIENEYESQNRQKCRFFLTRSIFLIFAVFITLWVTYHQKGILDITMLDVGQGDGIYIHTPDGMNCFVDGGSTDISQVGIYRIIPFLEYMGVGQLDYVFVSHGDEDHMNGIEQMLQSQELNIKISTLVMPGKQVWDDKLEYLAQIARKNNTKVVTIQEGQRLEEHRKNMNFILTCVGPTEDYAGEAGNAASMVLDLQYGDFDMLFTGDLEGEGESQLIQDGNLRKYDILKVAHHGSKNSTSEKMLEITAPSIALISAGIHNRYGHPHQETVERLKKQGSSIYNTQKNGAISIRTDGKNLRINVLQNSRTSDII